MTSQLPIFEETNVPTPNIRGNQKAKISENSLNAVKTNKNQFTKVWEIFLMNLSILKNVKKTSFFRKFVKWMGN